MPQLSLYLDEKTLRKIETAAKIEKLSISKYVVKKLNESINDRWPDQYERLFGCIDDETFLEPADQLYEEDTDREEI